MVFEYTVDYSRWEEAGAMNDVIKFDVKIESGRGSLAILDGTASVGMFTVAPVCEIGPGDRRICQRVQTFRRIIDIRNLSGSSPESLKITQTITHDKGYLFDSVTVTGRLYWDFDFVLSVPRNFMPRDARDAVADCGANAGECFPEVEARISLGPNAAGSALLELPLSGKIQMRLLEISTLPGVSTNFGTDTGPDYAVEASRQEPNLFESITQESSSG